MHGRALDKHSFKQNRSYFCRVDFSALEGATDTGTASTHVRGLAQSLLGQSNHLKGEVEKLLSTARAA